MREDSNIIILNYMNKDTLKDHFSIDELLLNSIDDKSDKILTLFIIQK